MNSFRVELNYNIYITGSNAYLLSSEYATYLVGRYVEIKMLPLSFSEFMYFHDLRLEEIAGVLDKKKKQFRDKNGVLYDLNEVFEAYLRFGGMPGISDVGLDQEKALVLLDGIYSTVVIRDILEKGCYWFKQGHIFKNPFYYIDYVLAQVCAFQFLNKSNEDFKKAWDDYINICKIGGTKSFLEIVEIGNLESPFEENTMKNISQKVGALLENIKDSDL